VGHCGLHWDEKQFERSSYAVTPVGLAFSQLSGQVGSVATLQARMHWSSEKHAAWPEQARSAAQQPRIPAVSPSMHGTQVVFVVKKATAAPQVEEASIAVVVPESL